MDPTERVMLEALLALLEACTTIPRAGVDELIARINEMLAEPAE